MINRMKRFVSLISTPAWRLGTLFLWWGTFHLGWMVFMLWTNLEQARFRLVALSVLRLVFGMLLLVTHLKGVAFRPLRGIRIFLWLFSIALFVGWAVIPIIDSIDLYSAFGLGYTVVGTPRYVLFLKQVATEIHESLNACGNTLSEYASELEALVGRTWLFVAFMAQLSADTLHIVWEWRGAERPSRPRLCRSVLVGCAFAALPLASVLYPVLSSSFQWKACEAYGNELRELRGNPPSQEESKARLDEREEFKKREEELESAWKAGAYSEVFGKWEALKEETTGKWQLEKNRLQLLPTLLRAGIPDDASLCQRIQATLQEADSEMRPLERAHVLWLSDTRRQTAIDTGAYLEDEFSPSPFIRMHFRHCLKPMAAVPIGMERLWRCLILRRIDKFFQLELQSLDTPLEDMPALEARFDRWLDSIPWNYNLEAPNTKCMDGVGVHINRYFDLYGVQFWQATCREASVGVALRQYRLQHGEWPADLEQLVPSFLPKLSCDPFNNGPLKVANHPKYPNALTVYSARKIGDDARPDELLHRGFPVAEKYPLPAKSE